MERRRAIPRKRSRPAFEGCMRDIDRLSGLECPGPCNGAYDVAGRGIGDIAGLAVFGILPDTAYRVLLSQSTVGLQRIENLVGH